MYVLCSKYNQTNLELAKLFTYSVHLISGDFWSLNFQLVQDSPFINSTVLKKWRHRKWLFESRVDGF